MSDLGWIYGCIIAGGSIGHTMGYYYPLNKSVIENLPESKDYQNNLLLCKGMFTVPMPEPLTGDFYRYQMIHFAGSFNHLADYRKQWLQQFESLLLSLYWFKANVHMRSEKEGEYNYFWKSDPTPMFNEPPEPIQEWELKGWPRDWDTIHS